jgi:hypothetical protein
MSPPANTLAIVVNVGKQKATLIMWEKTTGNGVTRVGTEEEEKIGTMTGNLLSSLIQNNIFIWDILGVELHDPGPFRHIFPCYL